MGDIRNDAWYQEITKHIVTSLLQMSKDRQIELVDIKIQYSRRGENKIKILYDTKEGQKSELKSFSVNDGI